MTNSTAKLLDNALRYNGRSEAGLVSDQEAAGAGWVSQCMARDLFGARVAYDCGARPVEIHYCVRDAGNSAQD